jgi:hypothetical protein
MILINHSESNNNADCDLFRAQINTSSIRVSRLLLNLAIPCNPNRSRVYELQRHVRDSTPYSVKDGDNNWVPANVIPMGI